VVVGSGAGGASCAVTLARGGAQVAIVEAGAWRDPEHYPHSCYGAMRDLFDDWGSQLTRGRALWPIVQARTMGGTTVINSAICVRTPGDIFRQWSDEHGLDGERLSERLWGYQDQIEEELFASVVPEKALGRSNRLAKKGADSAGYPSHYMTRYVRDCEGTGQCLQGCKKERKQSTNLNYLPELLRLGGTILSCAPADKVRFEGWRTKRAIGVEGHFLHPRTREKGARYFVRAKKGVFMAASVTYTAPLLMGSGLRLPALGRFFRSHPGTGIFGLYDEPVDHNIGATQGWATTHFRDQPGLKLETLAIPLEMVASRLSGAGTELMRRLSEYRHIAMWVHAVRAESTGRIYRVPISGRPFVRYGLDHADMLRFRQGLYWVAKTHVAAGAKALVTGIHGWPYQISPNEVDRLLDAPLDPRRYVAILSHLFGGAVMGTDPTRSVTDERGRVHGTEGLFVADASVIPTNLGVNPQHTIMALSRHFAHEALAA
jgi:choline dehydrogenase-like flavoprotein